jgi:hypothetical protein
MGVIVDDDAIVTEGSSTGFRWRREFEEGGLAPHPPSRLRFSNFGGASA